MKISWNLTRPATSTFIFCLVWSGMAMAQTNRAEAERWFNAGRNAISAESKLENYAKAVAADSTFFPALYNIGLLYKKQRSYRQAEAVLRQAYRSSGVDVAADDKAKLLYELGTCSKRLGKADAYRDALAEAKSLAQNRRTRGLISLEMAKAHLDRGDLVAADSELSAIGDANIHAEPSFKNVRQLIQREQDLQVLSGTARAEIEAGNLSMARTVLDRMRAARTGHKLSESQIAGIELLLEARSKRTELESIYQSAQTYMSEAQYGLAIAQFTTLLERTGSYKDAQAQLDSAQSRLQNAQQEAWLRKLYADGDASLWAGDWAAAERNFEKIVDVSAEYRDVQAKLASARQAMADEARALAAEEERIAARQELEAAKARDREANSKPAEPERTVAASGTEAVKTPAADKSQFNKAVLDSLYIAGLSASTRADWFSAATYFRQIQKLDPEYRDVDRRLADAQARTAAAGNPDQASQSDQSTGSGFDTWWLVIGAVFLTVIGGFVLSMPTVRARLFTARRQYVRAARIYESLLHQKPSRVQLYGELAELYLKLQRDDEEAVRVYNMVLQLGLPTKNLNKFQSLARNGDLGHHDTGEHIAEQIKRLQQGQ